MAQFKFGNLKISIDSEENGSIKTGAVKSTVAKRKFTSPYSPKPLPTTEPVKKTSTSLKKSIEKPVIRTIPKFSADVKSQINASKTIVQTSSSSAVSRGSDSSLSPQVQPTIIKPTSTVEGRIVSWLVFSIFLYAFFTF